MKRCAGFGSLFLRFQVMTRTHRVVPTPPVRSGQAGHTRGRYNVLSSFVVSFNSPNATRNKRRHAAPALSASRMHRRSITSPSTPSGRSRSVTSLLEAPRRSHRTSSAARRLFSLESLYIFNKTRRHQSNCAYKYENKKKLTICPRARPRRRPRRRWSFPRTRGTPPA